MLESGDNVLPPPEVIGVLRSSDEVARGGTRDINTRDVWGEELYCSRQNDVGKGIDRGLGVSDPNRAFKAGKVVQIQRRMSMHDAADERM